MDKQAGKVLLGRPVLMAAIVLAVVLVCSWGVWQQWYQTYHLATVQDKVLYRVGNRSIRKFANAVSKVKPRTAVSLVSDQELANPNKRWFKDEEAYLSQQRIRFVRIGVRSGGWPTTEDVRRFLAIVEEPDNRPVLVHCAHGVRRAGMMVAAYQRSVLKYDAERTKKAILAFGHSERTVGDIKRFIEVYDPESRAVT